MGLLGGTQGDTVLQGLYEFEYRILLDGAKAFKEIHDGTCSAPKIILIP